MCEQVTITPSQTTLIQSVTDVIESIALEETGLANVINAESCKIYKAISIAKCIDDLVEVNTSVSDTLNSVIKSQVLLDIKLKQISKLTKEVCSGLCYGGGGGLEE